VIEFEFPFVNLVSLCGKPFFPFLLSLLFLRRKIFFPFAAITSGDVAADTTLS
jgi:hypothetical protein